MKKALTLAAGCAAFSVFAGVPIKWNVETSRADERVIDVYHGESLDIEVTLKSYGEILQLPTNEVAATFWQTNGMNTAYWRTNNVEVIASNGIMRTTFGPEQDVGAKTLRGFIGIAGQIYRAAFVLRFKDAPGYNVSIVEWPYRRLDFDTIEVANPPYYTKSETDAAIVRLAPPPGNYAAVSNAAMNARSKTDLVVYEPVYTYSDWTWTPANDDLTQPWYNEDSARWEVGSNEVMSYVPIDPYVTDHDATNMTGEVSFGIGDSSGTYTWTRTRMQTGVRPTGDTLATSNGLASVRSVADAANATNAAQTTALESQASQLSQLSQSLSAAASTNDVRLAPVYGEWEMSGIPNGATDITGPTFYDSFGVGWWVDFQYNGKVYSGSMTAGINATELSLTCEALDVATTIEVVATRKIIGYTLGDQTDKVLASTNQQSQAGVSATAVTNIVRDLSLGGIWDATLEVWWTPRMNNGRLTYEATTNVNLNAEN